ncbi:hypothetical protein ABPG74_008072 [Tetrahymena malaccensis]
MFRKSVFSIQNLAKMNQTSKWNQVANKNFYHCSKFMFSGLNGQNTTSEILQNTNQITEIAAKSIKLEDLNLFNNAYLGDNDIGNILETTKPLSSVVPHDFIDKLSAIAPGNIYNHLDEFSRDALLYLCNDLGWGMGISIAALSFGIKLAFMPLMFGTQINALKMKLLEPETKNFQAQVSRLQKQGDFNNVREAQRQFSALQKKHGIRHWVSVAALTQIPVLITWFVSLRYVTSMPDKYPQLRTDGMLWFQDLAEQDPYCILPLLSATFSYLNISLNPNMGNMAQNSPFAKYMKYFKYFPFLTLPVVIFFPSALNLYWAISAFTHLIVAAAIRNPTTRSFLGIPKYLPGTILDRQNQEKVQKVIKAVISDNKIEPKLVNDTIKVASTLGAAAAVNASTTQEAPKIKLSQATQQVFTNKPASTNTSTANTSEKKISSGATTQVFTNKPTKKK